ncbi:hypothetical protein BCIN_11g03210 [Botrytis cinerea B05.10]|uniref:Uncharacterized protein n=1 Tax=Botryotinia fuckeliana (strain B05.10) TaxID=332648 RepID=A0A384JWR0_BOTFB|nr:hypothetical protein BCIN_11g03210 [Botrytis cinerea B05.10]ATZ55013.1 hypothetical protein BCIN_11g03210 [Botrytis cinerea B05.10]
MSPHLPTPSPLFRLLTPLLQSFRSTFPSTTSTAPLRTFTSTPTMHKKNPNSKTDPRVTLIRYHLQHPKTPRPLRFSRTRALRHWTIHRAWMILRRKQRIEEESELYRFVFPLLPHLWFLMRIFSISIPVFFFKFENLKLYSI